MDDCSWICWLLDTDNWVVIELSRPPMLDLTFDV
jgi:hypothetical protein